MADDSTAITVLVGVVVLFLLFVGVNVGLYYYAQHTGAAGSRKKKVVSKKKLKREVMRRGLQPVGE